MPWSSVKLLAFVISTIVGFPGLALLALVFLNIPIGDSGWTFPLSAAVALVAAVAWIVHIDRRASRRGNTSLDAGCLLILVGVAIVSALIMALRLLGF
jgi:hypothetical protein